MRIKYLLFCCIVVVANILQLSAQKFANGQFTLFSFTYEIEESVTDLLVSTASQITLNAADDKAKVNGMMVQTMWSMICKKMQDTFKTYILPANSFNDKVKYDEFGFPDISIQKAIKLSDTKYYFKMLMTIESEVYDNNGVKYLKDEFVPKVSLVFEIYDKHGYIPIRTADGFGTALKPVVVTNDYIAGMNFAKNKITTQKIEETLWSLFNRAATEVVLELKQNKKK